MKKIVLLFLVLGILGGVSACGNTGAGSTDGQAVAVMKGCTACHAVDDTPKIGPTWVGLYGSQVELDDGSSVSADEAYLVEAIEEPNAKIVKGYALGSMPAIPLTEEELNALVDFIKSVK